MAHSQTDISFLGARVPRILHREFKAICAKLGLEIQDVVASMIRLFLEDDEFRARVLSELNEG